MVQQLQSQPQGFNAFGSQQQPQQVQQQQVGGFNAFDTSPPKPQQQGSFNAFGNAQSQQPETKLSTFGAFGNPPPAAPAPSTFDAFGSFSSVSGKALLLAYYNIQVWDNGGEYCREAKQLSMTIFDHL